MSNIQICDIASAVCPHELHYSFMRHISCSTIALVLYSSVPNFAGTAVSFLSSRSDVSEHIVIKTDGMIFFYLIFGINTISISIISIYYHSEFCCERAEPFPTCDHQYINTNTSVPPSMAVECVHRCCVDVPSPIVKW